MGLVEEKEEGEPNEDGRGDDEENVNEVHGKPESWVRRAWR